MATVKQIRAAKRKDLPGRSTMGRDELAGALGHE